MLNNFDKISSNIDLFLENCDNLLILGIGNDIRGDDGLGPYIINQLSILKKNILNKSNLNDNNQEIIKNELKNQDNEFEFFDNVWSCDDFDTTKSDPQIYRDAVSK